MTKTHQGAALLGQKSSLPASPDEAELDILLLALRLRGGRQLARFASAVQAILRDPTCVVAILLGRFSSGKRGKFGAAYQHMRFA